MAGVKFTPSQQKAIDEKGTNIIVSAGAGSGKTAVLSERVLHFVKDEGYKLDEFLILTFTNLAAKEMKDRIRKKLEKNNLEESKNVDIADICTFDSYSFSIVKKYHFLLGISPKVSIVDSNVIAVKKREFVSEIFDFFYESKDPLFLDMITRFCHKDDNMLQDLVLAIHDEASLSLDTDEYLDTFIEKYCNEDKAKEVTERIVQKLFDYRAKYFALLDTLNYEPVNKSNQTPYQTQVRRNSVDFLHAKTYEKLISSFLSIENVTQRTPVDDEAKAAKEAFNDYKKVIKKFIADYCLDKEQDIYDTVATQRQYAELLIEIVKELEIRQMAYKKEKQVFEFGDIAKMALSLVKTNEEVRLSIKNKLKMIMIDEYQDTSGLQESFISLISNHNVYMVGDIKQSIYRFRNACSDIFQNKYDNYKLNNDGMAIDLNTNFRSRGEVLDDINTMFKDIMTNEIGGANYAKDHMIEYGNKDYLAAGDNGDSNHSHFITYSSEITGDERAEMEARLIARDIINKYNNGYLVYQQGENNKPSTVRRCRFSDFCVLMDRGTDFDTYKRVFAEAKIPLSVEADENIASNSIVLMLTSLLKMVKCIKKSDYSSIEFIHSYLSLARSFVFMYSDEKLYQISKSKDYFNDEIVSLIRGIIQENETSPLNELFSKIIFSLDIYHKLIRIGEVKSNELYLDNFLSYFEQMSDLDYSLDEFISYLDNLKKNDLKIVLSSQGTNVDSVRLMNIHKSKGLEFPIVYFSGLTKSFNDGYKKSIVGVTKNYGIYLPLESKKYNPIRLCHVSDEKEQDLSEKIRLFYVALTRTREKMIFVMPQPDPFRICELCDSKSFYDFVSRFYGIDKFESEYEDQESFDIPDLEFEVEQKQGGRVIIKETSVTPKEIKIEKASKDLILNTSSSLLKKGTDLHFLLEVIDFKNPDLSFVKNEEYQKHLKAFLASSLLSRVQEASIYKEYEFYDEVNQTHGTIDLMLVYQDHIDIIDYKTKHIDDVKYEKQLKVYKDFIKRIFNKKVNTFLYSIIDETQKEI